MSDNDNPTDAAESKTNFWTWLRNHKRGQLHNELTDELAKLVGAVRQHDKPGTLTLKITVSPTSEYNRVRITDELKPAPPKPARGAAYMFSDEDGGLHVNDPDQMSLNTELRVVEDSQGDPLVVDTGTGEVVDLR